jgi:putative hydrolase of the HAD superfamily
MANTSIRLDAPQSLLIDADDTLWENNIYFEAAWDDFLAYLDHSSLDPAAIRAIFDEIELANIKINGYGAANFARNMAECYRRLCERQIDERNIAEVLAFADRILHQPIELLGGVEETLGYLASRGHRLILFTKGNADEQRHKVDRSQVSRYFHEIEIVREKDAAAYTELAARHRLAPAASWMVGNSPKSDINPALEAGLNAVFVPHERTWALERTDLREPGPGRLEIVTGFAGLQSIF